MATLLMFDQVSGVSMMSNDNLPVGPKRTDVGYKRPPAEHQFKLGQKPPPRKKRVIASPSRTQLLMKILNEEQRVQIDGRPRWCTNAELVLMVAFQLAENGNATIARLLIDNLWTDEVPVSENEPVTFITPPGEPTRAYRGDREIDPADW